MATVSVGAVFILVAAGVVAGAVGSAGGITSLVSYPALLVVGVPVLPANVANLVALVACWPGSALGSSKELAGSRHALVRTLPVAAAGGAVGAGLLVSTPSDAFERIVPFLIVAGSLALLVQPKLNELRQRRALPARLELQLALALIGSVAVYGGYFGAGSGVMLLAIALVLLEPDLPRANALKNMLVGAVTIGSAIVLIAARPVDWAAVGPLSAGLFVGSIAGPALTRRLPPTVVRWCVAVLGFGLAVALWVHPG